MATLFGHELPASDGKSNKYDYKDASIWEHYKFAFSYIVQKGYFRGHDNGYGELFYAVAVMGARWHSNAHLDYKASYTNGDGSIDCGIYQWNTKAYFPGVVSAGIFPKEVDKMSDKEKAEWFFKTYDTFEKQFPLQIDYNLPKIFKDYSDKFTKMQSECGQDLNKTTICMACILSRHGNFDYPFEKGHENYLQKGYWAKTLYDKLVAEGGASALPAVDTDGTVNNSANNNGSTYVSGGGSYIRGQNYGGRTTKTGNPNTVYNLSSTGKKDNVLELNSYRKEEFIKKREEMINQIPNREREIIITDEIYNNSILKTTQRSKQERKQTVSWFTKNNEKKD